MGSWTCTSRSNREITSLHLTLAHSRSVCVSPYEVTRLEALREQLLPLLDLCTAVGRFGRHSRDVSGAVDEAGKVETQRETDIRRKEEGTQLETIDTPHSHTLTPQVCTRLHSSLLPRRSPFLCEACRRPLFGCFFFCVPCTRHRPAPLTQEEEGRGDGTLTHSYTRAHSPHTMSSPDTNTERRLARLRAARADREAGVAPAASPFTAAPTPTADSSPTSGLGWIGYTIAGVSTCLLLRSLLKGTAPSPTSHYSRYIAQGAGANQTVVPRTPPGRTPNNNQHQQHHQHHQHHHHQQHQHSYAHSHSAHYGSSSSSDPLGGAKRDRAYYEQKWRQAKSDFEKYDNLQEQARMAYSNDSSSSSSSSSNSDSSSSSSSTSSSGFQEWSKNVWRTSFHDHDPALEFSLDQARADYVQSKFHSLKQSKRRTRHYQTWNGAIDFERDQAETAEEEAEWKLARERGEEEITFRRRFQAYRTMQREFETHPKFIEARAILFDTPDSEAPDDTSTSSQSISSASTSTSPSDGAPLFLTSHAIRRAYFARAKECHPDIVGGDSLKFQKLTDAYELLLETIQPLEKKHTHTP